jgi:hypothetical protein
VVDEPGRDDLLLARRAVTGGHPARQQGTAMYSVQALKSAATARNMPAQQQTSAA